MLTNSLVSSPFSLPRLKHSERESQTQVGTSALSSAAHMTEAGVKDGRLPCERRG